MELVKRYFGGRAEGKSFVIADAAFSGRRQAALEELRWALTTGVPADLRHLGVRGLGPRPGPLHARPSRTNGGRPRPRGRRAAVEAQGPQAQSQGWTDVGLARAIRAVAQADADIKGAASDATYTLERLVLTITGLRASPQAGH